MKVKIKTENGKIICPYCKDKKRSYNFAWSIRRHLLAKHREEYYRDAFC